MLTFNIRLRALRKEKNRRQEDVAAVLGVKRATYSGYERGVILPPYPKIEALSEYFGVTIEYLMGEPEKSTTETPPTDVIVAIENLISELDSGNSLLIDGVELEERSRELLRCSLEGSLKMGKLLVKRKD